MTISRRPGKLAGMNSAAPDLKPLTCPSCGAPVPLGPSSVAKCAHCGKRVRIPAAHLDLRKAQADRAKADVDAKRVYARLAGRPPWLLRMLYGWFNPAAMALGVFPAMFIVGVGIEGALAWIASKLGSADYFDTWLADSSSWNAVFGGIALAYVGTILAALGQRRALSRAELQRALAAKMPEVAGHAFECRLCGAALHAEEGQLGVSCPYCRADNLLFVPKPWVKKVSKDTRELYRQTRSAREAVQAENVRVRKSVGFYVAIASVLAGLSLLAFRQEIHDDKPKFGDWPPSYSLYSSAKPPIVAERRLKLYQGQGYQSTSQITRDWPVSDTCAASTPITSELEPEVCRNGRCDFQYYAALKRSDTLTIVAQSVPEGSTLRVQQHSGMAWDADDVWRSPRVQFGKVLLEVPLASSRRVLLKPQIDAWHRIAIAVPKGQEPPSITLCITLRHGHSP